MKCPFCAFNSKEEDLFCTNCGKKLFEIIKEEIQKELRSELKEFQTPDIGTKIPTPVEKNDIKSKEEQEIKAIPPEYSDMKKDEYRTFLKSLFSDRILTAEKITLVADKI